MQSLVHERMGPNFVVSAISSLLRLGRALPLLIGIAVLSAGASHGDGVPTSTIEVVFEELRNSDGRLQVFLFSEADGFPMDAEQADAILSVPIPPGKEVRVKFTNIAAGSFAIAAYHDENDNDELDENLLCWPVEGFGFSNNATGLLGLAPKFEQASFSVSGPSVDLKKIRVRY